jgi:ABC-type methionine transport system ATPase subunit
LIRLIDITKRYRQPGREIVALSHVDLTVASGEVFGVVGRSGAGKSTLAQIVNLLERPSDGRIVVAGEELTGLGARALNRARRQIGMVFQQANLLSGRSAAGNVALPLEIAGIGRRERRARVDELLERVGLGEHGRAYPAQLSGGQQQRVGIARALAARPSVLLCDEATSDLDPETTGSILDLLRDLRTELGLTILVITHEMDVVRAICDRAALLDAGRVMEQGTVAELIADPASRLGRALVPDRMIAAAAPASATYRVVYGLDTPDPAWLSALSRELGADVALLGAAVEAIEPGGGPAGHATIAVPAAVAAGVPALLAARGLHAERIAAATATLEVSR